MDFMMLQRSVPGGFRIQLQPFTCEIMKPDAGLHVDTRGGGGEAGVWFHSYRTDIELRTSCSLLPELTSEDLLTDTRATAAPTLRLICSTPPVAGIIEDMNICYILDGILILYGLILTVLYCRLRMVPDSPEKQPVEGGIYAGLRSPCADTYETIGKKPIV
ncbi:Fc receptor, IgE, high affinity I, gamma polypeptide like [Limanda limanda]|uniref:Fc receptor, IgE, high affinity I, gamma polypeptide like n=1 Tax=Limanda limanda TaxID=27771 RepID=UPI0029C73F97|nr:Fc receptor, IgE, high affinity I, gamma polypeptide like [Limanda limanda]